jgi:putative spermidine/putrescine transport system permease protein
MAASSTTAAVREAGESRWNYAAFVVPLLLFVVIVFDVPLVVTSLWSFTDEATGAPTLGNYAEFLTSDIYARIIWRTMLIAGMVTLACAALGYPLAYWTTRLGPVGQVAALGTIVLTFWVSILVRTYAWIVILGNGGVVNRWLQSTGLTRTPIEFLYNEFGVMVGMVNVLLPFFVLPLYAAMRRIDRRLLDMAESLGASRTETFWRVFFPLSLPGLGASMVLAFILSLGFYITPAILGGGRVPMVANMMDLLINQFARWQMAAVISVALLLVTLLFYGLYQWLRERS